ncbi:MAG: hypothetical protein N5P05_004618 (plasmid) [Chroococcopsis gigantea SAG 12.99]|jgi:hypothetical protein|nr:hypothetical protein [Chroococcopsis gigantea SAG 12.99]
MLAVLGDYLKKLNTEIEDYEALIVQKRLEAEKLSQLQGQIVEALSLLREVVTELRVVDPSALEVVQRAAFQIFESGNPKQITEMTGSPSDGSDNHTGSTESGNGASSNLFEF